MKTNGTKKIRFQVKQQDAPVVFDYVQCPCCDHFSLKDEGYGVMYNICPVCFWEHYGDSLDEQDEFSDPNGMTLRNGRGNFKAFGACDVHLLKHVCSEEDRKKYRYKARTDPTPEEIEARAVNEWLEDGPTWLHFQAKNFSISNL